MMGFSRKGAPTQNCSQQKTPVSSKEPGDHFWNARLLLGFSKFQTFRHTTRQMPTRSILFEGGQTSLQSVPSNLAMTKGIIFPFGVIECEVCREVQSQPFINLFPTYLFFFVCFFAPVFYSNLPETQMCLLTSLIYIII